MNKTQASQQLVKLDLEVHHTIAALAKTSAVLRHQLAPLIIPVMPPAVSILVLLLVLSQVLKIKAASLGLLLRDSVTLKVNSTQIIMKVILMENMMILRGNLMKMTGHLN